MASSTSKTRKPTTVAEAPKGRRLRDPVHGLIVFDETDPIDALA